MAGVSKKILKLLGRKIAVTVKRGPLQGFRILIVSPMRFFKGTYEKEQAAMFTKTIRRGDIVYDIGAHFGFYSLIASRAVGNQGRVYAFEPDPYNCNVLRQHVLLNKITNVTLIPAAISHRCGKSKFTYGSGTGIGHLSEQGEEGDIEVDTFSIDQLIREKVILPPNVIKIDVEGAEMSVLKGASHTINLHCPIIFVSIHEASRSEEIDAMREFVNYRKLSIGSKKDTRLLLPISEGGTSKPSE